MTKKDMLTVQISPREYEELTRDSLLLEALYSLGVEDWEFFDDAVRICDGIMETDEHYESTLTVDGE